MKFILLILTFVLIPFTTLAGEKIKGTNFYVGDTQSWETGEGTGYWIWHAKGIEHPTEGPLETNPIECHGAGFWDQEESWGEGICIIGAGDDIHTSHWKREKGQEVGQSKYVSGTGKFEGIKGEVTIRFIELPAGRSMAEWEGEVSLAK